MKSIAHSNFVTGGKGVTVTDDDLNSVELRVVLTDELAHSSLSLYKKDQSGNASVVKEFHDIDNNEISTNIMTEETDYESGTIQYYLKSAIVWDGDTTGREMVHYQQFDEEMSNLAEFKYYKVSDAVLSSENIEGTPFEYHNPDYDETRSTKVITYGERDNINGFFIYSSEFMPLILVVTAPSEAYPVSAGTYFIYLTGEAVDGSVYTSKYYMDNTNENEVINFNIAETLNPNSDNIYVDYANDVFEIKKVTAEGGGGTGTGDYNELINKPRINGVELKNNKSFNDLGAKALSNSEIDDIINSIGL